MVAKCLDNGEQSVAERKRPRNSILETANLHFGSPIVRKPLKDDPHDKRDPVEDKDVIHVEEAEREITQNLIHKALESVTSISEAKGH